MTNQSQTHKNSYQTDHSAEALRTRKAKNGTFQALQEITATKMTISVINFKINTKSDTQKLLRKVKVNTY